MKTCLDKCWAAKVIILNILGKKTKKIRMMNINNKQIKKSWYLKADHLKILW